MEDIPTMVAAEFKHLGFFAHTRDVAKLSAVLENEGAEYGEVGIMAACLGYLAGKGLR